MVAAYRAGELKANSSFIGMLRIPLFVFGVPISFVRAPSWPNPLEFILDKFGVVGTAKHGGYNTTQF
jgi:hypothetical protein